MKTNVITIAYCIMMVRFRTTMIFFPDVPCAKRCHLGLLRYILTHMAQAKNSLMQSIQRDRAWHTMNCRLYITLDIFQHKMDFFTWGHNWRHFPSARATGACLQLLKLPLWPDKSPCTNPSLSPAHFCNLLKLTIHIKLAFSRLVYGSIA